MDKIKYRKDIDALRGISILLVVLFHAFPDWISGGYIGVDIFFVISGFLITSILYKKMKNNEFSFIKFFERRVRRIFPALFFVLFVTMIVGWVVLFPDEYRQLGHHAFFSTIFLQNFVLISELGYFDVASHYKPFLHLWTLSVEEQYYLFWPIFLFAVLKSKIDIFKAIIAVILFSFVLNIYYATDYKDEVFFHSLTRFWELGVGSLLAIYSIEGKKLPWARNSKTERVVFVLGVAFIMSAAFIVDGETMYPYWYGLLPTLGAVFIIAANQQLTRWGGLVQIGLISYPLYLWHWVVISFGYIYLGKRPDNIQLILLLAASFLLSYLTVKYVEKLRFSRMRITVPALIAVATVVGVSGFLVSEMEGLPSRTHLIYLDKFKVEFERAKPTDEACDSYVKATLTKEREFYYCRSNKINSNKLIAVIGDSHAHVLYPGIAAAAEKLHYGSVLLANSSCPTLVGFLWGKNPDERSKCEESIDQIFTILSNDHRFDKVIISTRGPVYIHGEVAGKISYNSVLASLNNYEAPNRLTYETFFSGLEKSLETLENISHVKNVYSYLENPELDFLPKEVVPRPLDYWGISIQDSVVDRSLYMLRMQNYRDLMYKTSSRFKKASVIDVAPYMCEESKCIVYKDGNFLYADSDHFSIYGSHYIAEKTIDQIINPPNISDMRR